MSELDAIKERIAFLTKIFFVVIGIIVITVSGLITSLTNKTGDELSLLFWLGIIFVLMCLSACLVIFIRINQHIEKIRNL